MDEFLTTEKLPWTTLYETEAGAFKPNPTQIYYGVSSFPTTILIGKDGKVLAKNVRGPKLGELLKEQLGAPEPAAAETK